MPLAELLSRYNAVDELWVQASSSSSIINLDSLETGKDRSLGVKRNLEKTLILPQATSQSPYSISATRHSNTSQTAENLLSVDQAAFPRGHSTSDQVTALPHTLRTAAKSDWN